MTKNLLFSSLYAFLFLMTSNRAEAQITGIQIVDFIDTASMYCVIPSVGNIIIAGSLTGTPAPNDSVDIYINFGDGTDTSFKTPIIQSTYFMGSVPHMWQIAGAFSMTATATANGISDNATTTPVTVSNSCASLTGKVYMDNNVDCVQDANESGLAWEPVIITNTTTSSQYYSYTNINGEYSANLPAGYTYTVASYAPPSLSASCPTSGTATVSITGTPVTADFAHVCNTSGSDASVMGWATNWRLGFNRAMLLWASNQSYCDSVSAVITLTLDPLLSLTSTTVPPAAVSGNTVVWNVTDLSQGNAWFANCQIYCDPSATMGDTLCVTVNIVTTPTDVNSSNNTYVICAPVNNSYDPNDKAVAPQGVGEEGNIVNGTELTYRIRFQNTGNDVAYSVVIKDELDEDLDYTTFKVLNSSHDMLQPYFNGNEVTFSFQNINLPAESQNEPASHGFVTYSISPKANLPLGTEIVNTAHIYFDTNPAIVTNTTKNTIYSPQSVQQISGNGVIASVYPNPAANMVSVQIENTTFTAVLYDMTGKTVAMAAGEGRATIHTASIPSGVYILKMITKDNKVLDTRLSVLH